MRRVKPPKGLGLNESLRHQDHSRPRTRREFVAQGFMTGAATVVGPTLLGLMADPRIAKAALSTDILNAVTACGITTGAGKIPFICFDLAGGGNIAGSNVLVGGPKGQMDFLSVAGYNKLGLPGSMVPNASGAGSNIDPSFGLRFHVDSAHLRGMKVRVPAGSKAMTNTMGTVIPALSQNDTNVNPHNPMYAIYQYGARGGLLDLIGSQSSMSGGNSIAPMTMMIPSAAPVKISSSQDSKGLVNTGQLSTLLAPADVTSVMESVKRISDAKYPKVQAYTDPTANAAALGPKGTQACGYTKAAYVVDTYGDPASVNPDIDPLIVADSGAIFTTAEYKASSDFQKTAAIMKLVIDGNAAAGTIEMGGFDYHTGDRMTGEGRDFNLGNCIGACLQYAALKNKPLMIYVFSDGSLASSGMIDNSVGGRGKGVWTGDNQNTASTYFLVFDPKARPTPAQSDPEKSLQIGYFNADGGLNTSGSPAGNNVFNLAQIVALNYMALHGAQAQFPTLYPGANLNNTLGSGSALDAVISYQQLASITNGKIG